MSVRTFFVSVATVLAPFGVIARASLHSDSSRSFRVHIQLKPFEYCMGSVYRGTLGIQGGGRVEALLAGDAIIPEVQYHLDYLNMGKILEISEGIKGFNDLKIGIRLGIPGTGSFNRLRCIDRSIQERDVVTTYYEQEKVMGKRNFGITAGFYKYRSFINPFTKESEKPGVTTFSGECLYLGLAKTKYIDGKAKKYNSGNVCTWDQYSYWYASFVYALSYKIGEALYYNGGSESLFPHRQHLRPFNRGGFLVGYENGRMLRGFVGNFELGAVPSLKGRGFFFKVGAGYVIGF